LAIKKRTIIVVILISVITITALFVPAWFYVSNKLSRLDSYKESITQTAKEKLNRDVTYETGKATLTLRKGLSVQFTNVVITEKDSSLSFLKCQKRFFQG
jgi:uncharacterized ion transporter superfamily protein YfcC